LQFVAAEDLILVSSGGSDWLTGSGKLEKVDGGFRLTGRKIFASGVPAGDVLMTTGVYDDPAAGPTVIHFPLPLRTEGVTVPSMPILVGEMENQLVTAQLAHAGMVDLAATHKPGPDATSATLCRRTITVNAVTGTVQKALEVAGGAGFYRAAGLERAFRDIQAARYHPVPEKPQTRLTGRVLLGLDIDG
jgi:alkylation response protein AidB-like acyl-CoA dehydrogenase